MKESDTDFTDETTLRTRMNADAAADDIQIEKTSQRQMIIQTLCKSNALNSSECIRSSQAEIGLIAAHKTQVTFQMITGF